MNATVNVVCYRSKTLANGEHPLMISVCKNKKRKYQSLGISVNPKYWDFEKNRPRNNCPNKELILKIILEKESEFQKQILELNSDKKDYSATSLLTVVTDKIQYKTVLDYYTELIKNYNDTGRRGNALVYQDSLNSLKRFTNGKLDIPFGDIDVNWLIKYEEWMRGNGCLETSMSVFFRTLRSAYNKAIRGKFVNKNLYPFVDFKISKFSTKTQKRAVSKPVILEILNLDLSGFKYYVQFAKDIFIFSYLCGGINFTDIAYLTNKNVEADKLFYDRRKTHKRIEIPLKSQAKCIIEKFSEKAKSSGYLFPILDRRVHFTNLQEYNRIHKVMSKVNKALKTISELIGEEINLTTYVARHSYASVLKNSGVNVALIGETLGHSDLKTTQIYLDSFENSQIDAAMENLL